MPIEKAIHHCNQCGSLTTYTTPSGDDRPRHICQSCNYVQYINPKLICGCLPLWDDKILLCKRSIEPRSGLWTLPAGFMELHETLEEAAIRETWEEAGAKAEQLNLYRIINLPTIGQVYVLFSANVRNGIATAGLESAEVGWFTEDTIPWKDLAFRTIHLTLNDYLEDRSADRPLTLDVKTLT